MADINDLGVLNINEEIKKRQELQMQMEEHPEELQQQQQIQFAPEMTREQEKEALEKGRALANKMKDSFVMQKGVTRLSAPLTSELRSEYSEGFQDKSLMKSRESKIKNKKSRLYKKNEAANRIDAMEAGEFQVRDMRAKLRRSIPEEERLNLSVSETKDLSVLASMLTHDDKTMESKFGNLVDKYAGFKEIEGEDKKKKKVEMSPEEKEAARYDVMAEVANELLANSELDKVNLFDDASLSENAPLLERLTSMTAIFNRMLVANPGFMETLKKQVTHKQKIKHRDGSVTEGPERIVTAGGVTAERLTKQLEKLQAVSDVYRVRKLIITNPYYRTHYNEELSMNASENASPEQKYLAKLLRTSFYLGKNLQRLGSSNEDIHDASARLNAVGIHAEKEESRICRISGDDEDFKNTAEVQKAEKELRGSAYDKKVEEIKKKLKKERRANTDELLTELEHERFTMPEEEMKFDLKNVGKKKVVKKNFLISNPTTTYGLYKARKDKADREDTANEKSLKSRVSKIMTMDGVKGSSIGVQSKRLANHTGGDALSRQLDNFTGQFVENMTDEEVVEMVEGLTYSYRTEEKDRTPEQQKMAEDMYIQNYLAYTNLVHQAMKKIMNTVGDNALTLHTEDWARLMSNPRFANLISVQSAISANMEMHLPYEFLKKYSGQNVEHLKDFYMLSKASSAFTFIADGLRSALTSNYKDARREECEAIEAEANEKLKEVRKQIKKKTEAGVPEDSPEMRVLRQQEAEYNGESAKPETILLEREMKNVEEYRKKQFTDENDEDIKGNIYELNKENISGMLGLAGYREVEMLKNSSHWEYGSTSEKEKREYKDSLKSKGIPECYDMEIVKKDVLRKTDDVIKGLVRVENEAEKLGVDTDLVEENMAALTKVLKSTGYSDDDLKDFLSKNYKRESDNVEKCRKELTRIKEEDKKNEKDIRDSIVKKNEEGIRDGEAIMRLLDNLAERLNIEFKQKAKN